MPGRKADALPPLTRKEIVDVLRKKLSLSGRDAGLVLDNFLECMAAQLEDGGAVSFSKLGRLEAKSTPARPGRNPATGQEVMIPSRIRPVFTLSRSLRDMLKQDDKD